MLKILLITFISSTVFAGPLSLETLTLDESTTAINANIKFDGTPNQQLPTAEYINETIQIDIPQAEVKDGKILRKVNGQNIKSLFAYQLDEETARFRIILNKGLKAEDFKDRLSIENAGNDLRVSLKKPAVAKAQVAIAAVETLPSIKPREMPTEDIARGVAEEKIDVVSIENELRKLATTAVGAAKTSAATAGSPPPAAKTSPSQLAEDKIPVFANPTVKKAKIPETSTSRVMFGLIVLALGLVGFWFAANRWMQKRNLKNPQTSIKVMTQHYLGPKKSLAIISVAGESILIGVTDQNITLIKSLALLDEEVAQINTANFQESLKTAENQDPDSVEDYAVKGIKDIVSDRLKGMRNLW